MVPGMTGQFYDKVTRKFGTFQGVPRPLPTYPQGNPEEMFEQKLFELSGKDKVALDLGCGDGRFTLRMAGYFQEIVGIDSSVERLKLAQAEQQLQEQTNVRFEQQDASQTSFAGNIIDLVYSRRGPTPYQECYRITKPKGYFLTISIGEKDAWELKQTFGRGQGYGAWKTSALEQAEERLQRVGFEVVYRQDVLFDEYFASYHDLDVFLQGVPIFEDFDSEKDRLSLEAYAARFQTDKGIHLPRHRFLVVAVKS
jgi:SAM-dependent methyltransferase